MNLLAYFVHGLDRAFDINSLIALKSRKAYKYSYESYLKNVWLYQCQVLYSKLFLSFCILIPLVMMHWKCIVCVCVVCVYV